MSLKKRASAFVIVAHPDDEAIFFSGLMLSKKYTWSVICVTDGNADGMGSYRKDQFKQSCKSLGVKHTLFLDFPDEFERRIDTQGLSKRLLELPVPKEVYTHGIIGEYGHPHHQDVSYATHKAFNKKCTVWSVSYNTFPELTITLTEKQFKLKTQILWKIYYKEIRRFLNFLPATASEGFQRISIGEVEALYHYLTKGGQLDSNQLKKHRWLIPYLESGGGRLDLRPF